MKNPDSFYAKKIKPILQHKVFSLVLLYIAMLIIFTVWAALRGTSFLKITIFRNILNSLVISSFLTIGAGCLLIAGHMDLSQAAIGAFGSMVLATAVKAWGLPWYLAIIAALVALVICIFCILLFNLNTYSLVISDIVFTFVLAYLDTDSVRRFTRFSVDWIEIFKKPLIATGAMGVCCLLVYLLVHRVEGSNIIALFLSIIVAVAVYFVVLVNIGGVSEEDMDNLPMGHKLELLKIPGLPSFDKKKKRRPVPRHVSRRPVHTDKNRRPRGKR